MFVTLSRLAVLAIIALTLIGPGKSQTPYLDAYNAYQARDYVPAYAAFIELAQAGDPDAMTNVAIMFDNGQGVEKNVRRAAYWYRKAARMGIVEAQYNLADMYRVGAGVDQNNAKAREWYTKVLTSSNI